MDSILNSVKKLLGITENYTNFDEDIITFINGAFFILYQRGVGPDEPFSISDATATWDDFVPGKKIELVKTYIFAKVKKAFDPPSNSSHLSALEETIRESEWRLSVEMDPGVE